jgi:hypothetical protein
MDLRQPRACESPNGSTSRDGAGKPAEELLSQIDAASKLFKAAARERFRDETEF